MTTFPIIRNGHLIFRRWYLLVSGAISVLLLAILLKVSAAPYAFFIVGIFVLLFMIIYLLFRNYRETVEIFADEINIREEGRLVYNFERNKLAVIRFKLLHPSVFMTGRLLRYYTRHFLEFTENQETYEYEVQERDVQPIIKQLRSMSYPLTDLADAMNYFQEDPFYKYAFKVMLGIMFLISLIIVGFYLYF